MEIEDIIRKLAHREIRLRRFEETQAPEMLLEHEKKLVALGEAELALKYAKIELVAYLAEAAGARKNVDRTYCPACKYTSETPDGRVLTEDELEERNYACTLHPEIVNEGCDDFVDDGTQNWNSKNLRDRENLVYAEKILREKQQEITGLTVRLAQLGGENDL